MSSAKPKEKDTKHQPELSEEDQLLKERLETYLETLFEANDVLGTDNKPLLLKNHTLELLTKELKSATSSMTGVPKPLKFLRPNYGKLVADYSRFGVTSPGDLKEAENENVPSYTVDESSALGLLFLGRYASMMSVLAMTYSQKALPKEQSERQQKDTKKTGQEGEEKKENDTEKHDSSNNNNEASENQQRLSLEYRFEANAWYSKLDTFLLTASNKSGIRIEAPPSPAKDTDEEVEKTKPMHSSNDEIVYIQEEESLLGIWGHEYVRSLAGEIGQEYNATLLLKEQAVADSAKDHADEYQRKMEDLWTMAYEIVPFHLTHNAEAEAIDLLLEIQQLPHLLTVDHLMDNYNSNRICLYLLKLSEYTTADPDDYMEVLNTAYELFLKKEDYFNALRVLLKMDRTESDEINGLLTKIKDSGKDDSSLLLKQCCFLLARQKVHTFEYEDDEDLNEIIGNTHLSEQFLNLARDLDVVDAKTPEDIFKSHLAETASAYTRRSRADTSAPDSARANLASTFVNAFVNAGYGQDKLMTVSSSDNDDEGEGSDAASSTEWLYKNKDHGMLSAAASLGSILMWNVEEGLTQIDKYLYSNEDYVKAGAALSVGILTNGVRNDADPALALLTEHVDPTAPHIMKCASITGLGIAYAGTKREDVSELLIPLVEDTEDGVNMLEVSLAALALGMIFVGSCDENVGTIILQRLMEASEAELDHSHARLIPLGLGLLFLGKMEAVDAMVEGVDTIEHKISKYAKVVLKGCAYARSGNVLEVQNMLHQCTEHLTEDAYHQAAAVLGVAMITMGEDVGQAMAIRTFDHLLHYCELPIKRVVPLALATLHISNPEFAVIDQLSRLSHDPDTELSQNAILAMGITSAGTNNSRVAGLLRQLSEFYSKDAGHMFCVRIAQGLLHMGKGLLTLSPLHSDRMLTDWSALGAIVAILNISLDLKRTLLDKTHYLLYYLHCAMSPRMLITINEDLSWRPVTVRVGQAVETVGQAGKPKTITGFQTHTTPVLLGVKERAELGTDEVLSIANILEGIVLLKDNPDFEGETKEDENKTK